MNYKLPTTLVNHLKDDFKPKTRRIVTKTRSNRDEQGSEPKALPRRTKSSLKAMKEGTKSLEINSFLTS